jgi:hypothetical protein
MNEKKSGKKEIKISLKERHPIVHCQVRTCQFCSKGVFVFLVV